MGRLRVELLPSSRHHPNGRDREGTGVVVGANVHESRAVAQVVDALRIGARSGRIREVMSVGVLRRLRLSPLAPSVFIVAYQLLLLGIHGDDGTTSGQARGSRALVGPPQGRFRVATRQWLQDPPVRVAIPGRGHEVATSTMSFVRRHHAPRTLVKMRPYLAQPGRSTVGRRRNQPLE